MYRLDFSATIQQPDGASKHVIIEIQKATKFATNIMRFRPYLGAQYQKKDNTCTVVIDGQEITRALPIVSIYFLGYHLEHTTAPVIKVARTYSVDTLAFSIHHPPSSIHHSTSTAAPAPPGRGGGSRFPQPTAPLLA